MIWDGWVLSLRVAVQGKLLSIKPQGSQNSLWACWTAMSLSRLYCRGQLSWGGWVVTRGRQQNWGGPCGAHTGEGGPDLQLFPTLAHTPMSPDTARGVVKGRGVRGAWGGLRGPVGRQPAVTSSALPAAPPGDGGFQPNLASFGEVSGCGAAPGGTPAFQRHSWERSAGVSLEKWSSLAKAF